VKPRAGRLRWSWVHRVEFNSALPSRGSQVAGLAGGRKDSRPFLSA